jgi:phosphopantothenoylcysteine decarboxylase/phosphopantothenate--cysteine ligase
MARSEVFKGLKVLITSGPTQEPLDPVRYLTNHSSGKQGHSIAEVLVGRGADVTLVSGPVHIAAPARVKVRYVKKADEMLEQCMAVLEEGVDVAICTAAVSDWRFKEISAQKLKKDPDVNEIQVTLVKNPDILGSICRHRTRRPKLVIGFAAETEHVISYALAKHQRKQCDWMLANDVTHNVFGADENTVYLVKDGQVEPWPTMTKRAVAEKLADDIATFFSRTK